MKQFVSLVIALMLGVGSRAAIIPDAGSRYFIMQTATLSAKVVGATVFGEAVVQDAGFNAVQQFEFIPVAGKTDTYFLRNGVGMYLINSEDLPNLTEFWDVALPGYGEWVLEGSALSAIKLKSVTSAYLGSDSYQSGTFVLCDKAASHESTGLKLVPVGAMTQNMLIDGGFENAVVEGAPLGLWINNNNRIFGNDSPTTQNFRTRIINNGYQSVGNNALAARFYGDENSYTRLSFKLTNLTKGASYRFSYKYKQGNTNTTDAFVNTYATIVANDASANSFSNIAASTPPSSTATTQVPGTAAITFFAPATECFVVWEKNPAAASGRNWLFYIDDMVLVKTADANSQIYTETNLFSFNNVNRTSSMKITGVMLTDSIRITAPTGITVSPAVLAPDASLATVTVRYTGVNQVSGNIELKSGNISRQISVTAVYNAGLRTMFHSDVYYIQQRTGGKVLSRRSDNTIGLKYADAGDLTQQLRFIGIPGSDNPQSYFIANAENQFLKVAANNTIGLTSLAAEAERWLVQGQTDTLVYITRAIDAAMILSADSVFDNSLVYANKTVGHAHAAFVLQKMSDVLSSTFMFDPDFEFSPFDGGPLGTWIPNNDPLQFGGFGYSRVQGFNGWQSSGNKTMYLRFLGDGSSYNSISQKLFNLTPGATYRLDLQYKCQSTSSTSLVNIYATTAANAPRTSAIGGFYTTTTVAASNLASQAAQSTSLTFVAPLRSVWIVYAKNTTGTNYNFFPDNLRLTETIPSSVSHTGDALQAHAYLSRGMLCVDFDNVSAEKLLCSLFDVQGRLVHNIEYMPMPGMNEFRREMNLPSGIYLLRLTQGSNVQSIRILVP
jgi:hypothetical protein